MTLHGALFPIGANIPLPLANFAPTCQLEDIAMAVVLYHHPYTRAANCVWMLEEVGVSYELRPVDVMAGEQRSEELLSLNPMGKIPVLVDGEAVITESAAIGLYLADRYSLGELAPRTDEPARGAYLRWSLFSPSVIEPGLLAKRQGWEVDAGTAGWGSHEAMLDDMRGALADRPYLLGEQFSMADLIFGGTIGFMLRFGMLSPEPLFENYVARLSERPAYQRADAQNLAIRQELGLE